MDVSQKSTQEIVPVKEVRDGVVVLKDNSLRMIIMVSSMNFALKSSEEQTAIILQYQNFLNSLDFSLQFLIQSRSLNVDPYIETLTKRESEQTNELLKVQTREYIEFVREFVTATKIVNKNFYAIVPYTPGMLEGKKKSGFDFAKSLFNKETTAKVTPQETFEEHRLQLQQRANAVLQGLSRIGLRGVPLNTEELIELFYGLYNPGEGEKGKIPEIAVS